MGVSTIVSLVPCDIVEIKPGLYPGEYIIPKSDGITPSVKVIHDAVYYIYLDEDRGSLRNRLAGEELANSIVNDYVNSQMYTDNNAKPALFAVPGEFTPETAKIKLRGELDRLRLLQRNWFLNVCRNIDDDWNQHHRYAVASSFHRDCAKSLGWKVEQHPWIADVSDVKQACPACGTILLPGVVVCSTCSCIIDPEKFKTLQFAGKGV